MSINEAGWCTNTCVWDGLWITDRVWIHCGAWSHSCSDNIKDNIISPIIIATARPWRTESVVRMLFYR